MSEPLTRWAAPIPLETLASVLRDVAWMHKVVAEEVPNGESAGQRFILWCNENDGPGPLGEVSLTPSEAGCLIEFQPNPDEDSGLLHAIARIVREDAAELE